MVRFEIEDNTPIRVAYGHDEFTGFFISVYDARLKWDPNNDEALNGLLESLYIGDGGGSYFDAHTGPGGFGKKIDVKVMARLWEKYGVDKKHVAMAVLGKPLTKDS
jgi:hypothetical protein